MRFYCRSRDSLSANVSTVFLILISNQQTHTTSTLVADGTEEELRFHELYSRCRPGDDESDSQYRYRQVCRALSTCCYVSVLRELGTDQVTLSDERLSANDVLALALALEVTSLVFSCSC